MKRAEPLAGKVALVTGSTTGIGLETARGLAMQGATVIVSGRSLERCEHAAARLRERTENPDVHAMPTDLSSLRAVRELADRVADRFEALHVLVNNAGLWHPKRIESADGYEDTFAVNHLAPFLLTTRLLDRLRAGRARVVTVSSRLHEREKALDFDDLMSRRRYDGLRAYRQSKLANVMFANELARRVEGTGITSNSLHPGDVATSVVRESRFLQWGLDHIARFFLKTPEEGAATSIHVATSPEIEGVTGRYFKDRREAPCAPAARDRAACDRLFRVSEELVETALRRS